MKTLIKLITKSTLTKVLTAIICAGIVMAIVIPIGLNTNKSTKQTIAFDNSDTKKDESLEKKKTNDNKVQEETKAEAETTTVEAETPAPADTNNDNSANEYIDNADNDNSASAQTNTPTSNAGTNYNISDDGMDEIHAPIGSTYISNSEEMVQLMYGQIIPKAEYDQQIANGTRHVQATDPWQNHLLSDFGYTESKVEGNQAYGGYYEYSPVTNTNDFYGWYPVACTDDNWITWGV